MDGKEIDWRGVGYCVALMVRDKVVAEVRAREIARQDDLPLGHRAQWLAAADLIREASDEDQHRPAAYAKLDRLRAEDDARQKEAA